MSEKKGPLNRLRRKRDAIYGSFLAIPRTREPVGHRLPNPPPRPLSSFSTANVFEIAESVELHWGFRALVKQAANR